MEPNSAVTTEQPNQPVTQVDSTINNAQPVNSNQESKIINSFIEQKAIENKAKEAAGQQVYTETNPQQVFWQDQTQDHLKYGFQNQNNQWQQQASFQQQLQQTYQNPQQIQNQQEPQLALTPEQIQTAIQYADVINEVIDSISTMSPEQINTQTSTVNNQISQNTKEIERVNEQIKTGNISDAEKMQSLQKLAQLETENQFMKDQMSYFKEIAWKQSLELQELKNNYENFQLDESEKKFLYATRAIAKDPNNLFAKMELSKMAQKILEETYWESLQPAIELMQQRQAFSVTPSTGIHLPQNANNNQPQTDPKQDEIRKAMGKFSYRLS